MEFVFNPPRPSTPCRIYNFHISQNVFLSPALAQNVAGGAYIVTKKLPIQNGEFEYRIKSVNEPFERVVRESELRIVGD